MKDMVTAIAVTMSAYHILFLSGVFLRLGIAIWPPAHMALHLAFVLALIFLLVPSGKGAPLNRLPWYDILLLLGGVAWNLYIFFGFDTVYQHSISGYLTTVELTMSWVMMLIVLEAARRLYGWAIPSIAAFFLVYALFTNYFPGFLHGSAHDFHRVGRHIGLFVTGMYGPVLELSATVVMAFMLFAEFLAVSGAGAWFIDIAQALLGHVRGGPAKVAVFSSALVGTISGSAVANVATTGVFTIPLMKSIGYKPHFAGAVEAVASNGGQIMPPVMGIAAFIMADFLGVSYGKIAAAAVIPAIVYFVAVFLMVDFEAAKMGMAGVPREQLPRLKATMFRGWHFVIPLVVLVLLLMIFFFPPELSALYSLAALVVVGLFKKESKMGLKLIGAGLKAGAIAMMNVAVICAVAGIIIGSLSLTGLGIRLSTGLTSLAGGNLLLLLVLTAIASLILGLGVTTSACYLLLAVLVAPALIKIGVLPLAAHFFIFYFGVAALITPPVCPAAFVGAAIANASPMRTGLTATRLGIATFLMPFMFVYSPALLLQGSPTEVAIRGVAALVGAACLASALSGYLLRPAGWIERIMFLGAAIMLIMPGLETDLIGIALLAGAVLWQVLKFRRERGQLAHLRQSV